jgi:hypothetical protein
MRTRTADSSRRVSELMGQLGRRTRAAPLFGSGSRVRPMSRRRQWFWFLIVFGASGLLLAAAQFQGGNPQLSAYLVGVIALLMLGGAVVVSSGSRN